MASCAIVYVLQSIHILIISLYGIWAIQMFVIALYTVQFTHVPRNVEIENWNSRY